MTLKEQLLKKFLVVLIGIAFQFFVYVVLSQYLRLGE